MPRVVITQTAAAGFERCRRLLHGKSPEAARRDAKTISRHLLLLESSPELGRPSPDSTALRELLIAFGDYGYVALYRYEPTKDSVYVLAFRHQREVGY